jgi:uncharacterized protein YdhG (YjbR/CyaY superfamily)
MDGQHPATPYDQSMPSPKRVDPDDFIGRLDDRQRPHLELLRAISLSYAPRVTEALKWNWPAYLRGEDVEGKTGAQLWSLQAFKAHASLRFSTEFFAGHIPEVTASGYEHGAGFLKIPFSAPVPEAVVRSLIEARLQDPS